MTETIVPNEKPDIVFASIESIGNLLDNTLLENTLKEDENNLSEEEESIFVNLNSGVVDYKMGLISFQYHEDFNPTPKEIEEKIVGWYMIKPGYLRLIQGAQRQNLKKQIDLIINNKILKRTELEERQKGVFSILNPEGDKYGILFIFHLDD